jgi:DnaJ family protein A protein 1/DnaJ family protein A protein 2
MSQDYYELLGVTKTATPDEIAKAYKMLSLKYHPDRGGDEEMFKKISHAKEVLMNEDKRRIYDQFGEEGLNGGGMPDPMGMFFNSGFGGFDMFGRQQQKQKVTKIVVTLTLAEFLKGGHYNLKYQRNNKCVPCDGTGYNDKQKHLCKTCGGKGSILRTSRHGMMIQQSQEPCGSCHGAKIDKTCDSLICKECTGAGSTVADSEIKVTIPKFYTQKLHTKVEKAGVWTGTDYTDLIVLFDLKLPENYVIAPNGKLHLTMNINLTETICGFSRLLEHPNGNKIIVVSREGSIINPENIYILRNLGLPMGSNSYSDLLLDFKVSYPDRIKLDGKQKLTFKSLEESIGPKYCFDYSGKSDLVIYLEDASVLTQNSNIDSDDDFETGQPKAASCQQQ